MATDDKAGSQGISIHRIGEILQEYFDLYTKGLNWSSELYRF